MGEKAFRLLRVSGEDQKEGYGFDIQQDDADRFCAEHDLEVSDNYVERLQETSTSWDREKFESCLERVLTLKRIGGIQWLVMPRVDRFSRNLGAASYYVGYLLRHGLKLGFGRENLSITNDSEATINLFMYLLHSFKADEDAKTIGANLHGGRYRRAKEGKYPGTPIRAGFILCLDEDKPEFKKVIPYQPHREVVEKTYDTVVEKGSELRAVRELRRQGVEFPPFPDELKWMRKRSSLRNCPRSPKGGYIITRSLLRSMIPSKAYIGVWEWKDIKIENNHEPLIPVELWEAANRVLARSYKPRGKKADEIEPLPLAGLIWCGNHETERRIGAHSARGRYICGDHTGLEGSCLDVAHQYLDDPIIETVLRALNLSPYIDDVLTELEQGLTKEEIRQVELKRKEKELTERLTNLEWQLGDIKAGQEERREIYWRMISETRTQLNEIKRELSQPLKSVLTEEEIAQVKLFLKHPRGVWNKMSCIVQNQLLGTLLEKIIVEHEGDKIHASIYWHSGIIQEVFIIRPKTNREDARWNGEEDNLLKMLYPSSSKPVVMGALPGRSWSAISSRSHHLGLERKTGDKPGGVWKAWTKEDEEKLKMLYQSDMPLMNIAEQFGRTVEAIQMKAASMRLRRPEAARRQKAEWTDLDGLVALENWTASNEGCRW